jgi:hypothetical protein
MADEPCDEENQEQFDIYGPLLSNERNYWKTIGY